MQNRLPASFGLCFAPVIIQLIVTTSVLGQALPPILVDCRIDRRNATEASGKFFVIFCARKSSADKGWVGHTFVVWAEENDQKQYSAEQSFGFYPADGEKSSLGTVPGDLKNEALEQDPKKLKLVTHRLTVQVNHKPWQQSQARIKRWETSDYSLLSNNCVHFAHDVAADLGIVVDRSDGELPAAFVARMIEATKPGSTKP